MTLHEAETLATALLATHGLTANGWRFQFDHAKTRFGVCKFRTKTIGLSILGTTQSPESEVRDTILHEIAHALAGPAAKHGWQWRVKAREIGCRAERCGSFTIVAEKRFHAVCPGCGKDYPRHRRPALEKRWHCPPCRHAGRDSVLVWR